MYSDLNDAPLAVVNLEQKEAFDNVDHDYLLNTMRAMGFEKYFLRHLRLLYSGSESSLTSPFSFEKGIRQGCPLSGLLYSIAIEPLLNKLRLNINKSGFKLPGTEKYCSVSAYADDVYVFVTSDAGFTAVEETYDLFGRASAAPRGYGPVRGPDGSIGPSVSCGTARGSSSLIIIIIKICSAHISTLIPKTKLCTEIHVQCNYKYTSSLQNCGLLAIYM